MTVKYLRVDIRCPSDFWFVDIEVPDDTTDTEARRRAKDAFEDDCVYSHELLDEEPKDWEPDEEIAF